MRLFLNLRIGLILFIIDYSVAAQSIFSPPIQITKSEVIEPQNAIIFDIDNDELNDVLVIGSYPDNMVWFKNLGDYKFSEKIPLYSNENLRVITGGIVSEDVNEDGFTDFIAYEFEPLPPGPFGSEGFVYRKCYWRQNLAGTGFGEMIEIDVDTNKIVSFWDYLFIEDVDGDGLKDLIYGDRLHWKKRLENGNWGENYLIDEILEDNFNYSLGDINGDGLLDIATSYYYTFNDSSFINIYTNIGSGGFQEELGLQYDDKIFQSIIVDYDSDGITDIIAIARNKVFFSKQNAQGLFQPPVLLHDNVEENVEIFPVLVADIDGNGEKDLITQDKVLLNNDQLLLHFNGGIQATVKGKLGNIQSLQEDYMQVAWIEGDPVSVVSINEYNNLVESFIIHPIAGQVLWNLDNTIVIDIDNDGDKDIISGSCIYECISTNPIEFSDCLSFYPKILDYEYNRFSDFLGVFDINNDDCPDFVTGSRNFTGTKKIKFFNIDVLDTAVISTLEFLETSFDIDRFVAVYSKDLDSDGYEDLIILARVDGSTSQIITFLNNTQAGLTFNNQITIPFRFTKLEFHDLDGSGVDEVLAYTSSSSLKLYYAKLTENGLIMPFELYTDFENALNNNYVYFTLGKINNDEIMDIYYSYIGNLDEGYSLLGQLPLGSFISGPNLQGQIRPHLLDDFDEDGNDELFYSEVIEIDNSIIPAYDGYILYLTDNMPSSDYQYIDSITFYSYQNIFPRNSSVSIDFDSDLDKDILYTSGASQISVIENNLNFPTKAFQSRPLQDSFIIYPNPINNSIVIELIENVSLSSIEIFDSVGRSIKNIRLEDTKNYINVSELQSGVYFLKAGSSVKRIIKK